MRTRPAPLRRLALPGALLLLASACGNRDLPSFDDPWLVLDRTNGSGPPSAAARADAGPSPEAIQLVGVALPPDDADGSVTVSVDLPPGSTIDWRDAEPQGSLVWPTGTTFWRVVTRPEGAFAEAQGLTLEPDGPVARLVRSFHDERGELVWPLRATVDVEQLARTFIWVLPEYRRLRPAPAELARIDLERRLRCVSCHQPDHHAADRVLQFPNTMVAPTDPQGLFTPMGLWTDAAPAPAHGVADPNADHPGLTASCPAGPVHRVPNALGNLRLRCSLGRVATLSHDLATADDHARARCATRVALAKRMSPEAQRALREPLAACGVVPAPQTPPRPDTDDP